MKTPPEKPLLICKAEAARLLCVSSSTINRMLRDKELRMRKIRGCVRIPMADVRRILGDELMDP